MLVIIEGETIAVSTPDLLTNNSHVVIVSAVRDWHPRHAWFGRFLRDRLICKITYYVVCVFFRPM